MRRLLIALGVLQVLLAGCGSNPVAPLTPSPEPSATPSAIVYDVHVYAFKGSAQSPDNAITEVDQGEQFKTAFYFTAYDRATGDILSDLPPVRLDWKQLNKAGSCKDRGAVNSQVEQWTCPESTGTDTALLQGCATNLLTDTSIGCAQYGVTVR